MILILDGLFLSLTRWCHVEFLVSALVTTPLIILNHATIKQSVSSNVMENKIEEFPLKQNAWFGFWSIPRAQFFIRICKVWIAFRKNIKTTKKI